MSNRFFVTQVDVDQNQPFQQFNMLGGGRMLTPAVNHSCSVSLILVPIDEPIEAITHLHNVLANRDTVCINSSDYDDVLKEFKDEFIEFLTERYPDKVLKHKELLDKLKE